MTATALPAANAASTTPAIPTLRCMTSETNSGTSATRSPKADQPVAKLDSSADRYARNRNASRIVTVERVGGPGAVSAECRKL